MTIYFAADHAGFELKQALVTYVRDMLGHEVVDCGAHEFDPEDDYPAFMRAAAESVSKDPHARGILLGGSGQGEAIVANRTSGVRAVVFYGGNTEILTLSREHNDANVLSLGARFMNIEEATEAVSVWLATPFSNEERHIRRITDIDRA
jgi:ribose 5-phosphate isomerase B